MKGIGDDILLLRQDRLFEQPAAAVIPVKDPVIAGAKPDDHMCSAGVIVEGIGRLILWHGLIDGDAVSEQDLIGAGLELGYHGFHLVVLEGAMDVYLSFKNDNALAGLSRKAEGQQKKENDFFHFRCFDPNLSRAPVNETGYKVN